MTPLPVYFSPCGGCTAAVVASIAAASKTILLAAYEFTSSGIACALLAAKHCGVDIQTIFDPTQRCQHGSQAGLLSVNGISVLYDPAHHIFHDKYIVIDDHLVIAGSFNFTIEAEYHNAENMLILDSKDLAASYRANWIAHQAHSKP